MDVKKITDLHSRLLTGISIEDLSDNSLLRYGALLISSFKSAKAVLRKLEPQQAAELRHWTEIREYTQKEIDVVLSELECRMAVGIDDFGEKTIISFAELVGKIRYTIYFETDLDKNAKSDDEMADIEFITE